MASPRDDVSALKRLIRRGCTNRLVRDVLLAALDAGATGKATKSGVMLYGPNGKAASVHFTQNTRTAHRHARAAIRSTGVKI